MNFSLVTALTYIARIRFIHFQFVYQDPKQVLDTSFVLLLLPIQIGR